MIQNFNFVICICFVLFQREGIVSNLGSYMSKVILITPLDLEEF